MKQSVVLKIRNKTFFCIIHFHLFNMTTISTFGTTKKPLLKYAGHFYVKDWSTAEKTYWRCIKYSTQYCHSRLHTCLFTNNITKAPTKHSCTFDGTTLELRKFDQVFIDRAKNTQETLDTIITKCIRVREGSSLANIF